MGSKFLKDGEPFTFSREFGFTGSASVSPRNHPTISQDEFGDDAHLEQEAKVPTFADGGGAQLPGKKIPKAGRAIIGALQLGKTIGQAQAGMAKGTGAPVNPAPMAGARPPMGVLPNAIAPGAGALPKPGAGVIPGMKKGGKRWAKAAFKPSHKGRLHRALGVPEDKPIPAEKMEEALHSKNSHVQHMARAAHNINK